MTFAKTLLAATATAALLCGAARAELVRVHGVVTRTHAGTANYAFVVNSQLYVIPMIGFGQVVQANKVELARSDHMPIDFIADTSQIITIHNGHTGPLARDIDP